MTAGIADPPVRKIRDSVVDALRLTTKTVGTDYHYAPDLVTHAPGVAPSWFDNPDWQMAYWVVIPIVRVTERTGLRYTNVLELHIVGAKAGSWPEDPRKAMLITPSREEVQYEIEEDIRTAMTSKGAFRRPDPDNVGGNLAINTAITEASYDFTKWPSFAIVSTRWEIHYISYVDRELSP